MAEKWVLRACGFDADKLDKERRAGVVEGEPFAAVTFTSIASQGVTGHWGAVLTKEKAEAN